ncbi:hypothetical protein [Leifsonia sp. fls2-241-R2A-40a]|uniref:hypothetical protein n=1 Tax=Leifsonia sp. fls2-241-R2A-40a TaxID=3040290 RepID=UPI00254A5DF3|nr:hypothetical protein [Leifsonia sp. fls2-241-R2A-40a]
MTTTSRAFKRPLLVLLMWALLGVVLASIAAQVILQLTRHAEVADALNVITFGTLSAFFVVFAIHYGRKGQPVQSTGGYVAAGCWMIYTALLVTHVV